MKRPENRGGARPGSGPKPKTRVYSDSLKKDVRGALARKKRETKKSFGQVLADDLYDSKTQPSVRVAVAKLIADILVVKESHRTEERVYAPAILPVLLGDPSKIDIDKLAEATDGKLMNRTPGGNPEKLN